MPKEDYMKLICAMIFACLVALPALCQKTVCSGPQLSTRKLRQAISGAKTTGELLDLACYSKRESARFQALARTESANLQWAYDNHVGGPKFPSNADHARAFLALYKADSERFSKIATQLETQAKMASPSPHIEP